MNFNVIIVLWVFVLVLRKCQPITEGKECVQRRLGACKVLTVGKKNNEFYFRDFHSPPPEGFVFKTSVEINLLENKYSFENNLPVERKRPIGYNLDNAALVTIRLGYFFDGISVHLGKKYYRLAEFEISKLFPYVRVRKYNRYTPSLPTFPYNIHLEMTTNGSFAIYADGNTEPFLKYQFAEHDYAQLLTFDAPENQTDLIAFVDCSMKQKPNCGSHHVDKLYGCREWLVSLLGFIKNFDGFQKTYGKDVLFDEFIVVDTEYSSKMEFTFDQRNLVIEFKVNSVQATLKTEKYQTIKSVRTEQWFEVPASPYAVRVLLTTGEKNNYLNISNLRNDTLISLNLCEDIGSIKKIYVKGPKLYFDCIPFNNVNSTITNKRHKKVGKNDSHWFQYHENGYNFTKTLLNTREFVKKPFFTYQHAFGNATKDWCEEEPEPTLLRTSKYDNDSLHAVIERLNTVLHSDLQKINVQNKAIVDTNTANADTSKAVLTSVLTELEKISNASVDANKVLLSELRSVKASIDALSKHLEQNATTVNNYNYNNLLNVTEFLKFIKQN